MGTSNANKGQKGGTPLIPSWLPADDVPPPPDMPPEQPEDPDVPTPPPVAPPLPPIPPIAPKDRFTIPRNNFSRFAASGGRDRKSLGRALSGYISNAAGGSKNAAQRMVTSPASGTRFLGVLSQAVTEGSREALRALDLESLAGRPIEEIFIGIMEYVCPEGGTLDEGIAREAFIETIADLAANGITDFDTLTADQMQTIFELYAAHAIEARLCNDIGIKSITLPADAVEALSVERQVLDFVRRAVADAVTQARTAMQALTPQRILSSVTRIYEQAYAIMESMAETEAEGT